MKGFIPDSKHLVNRRMPSGWDAHHICKTLVIWYPELLRVGAIHKDMRNPKQAMDYLCCLQDYPDDLQDIMILLAQRYGVQKAAFALDNAIRKYSDERTHQRRTDEHPGEAAQDPERLTA